MDASTLLEQYTQDLSNLPSELAYLLEELRDKDLKEHDVKKRINQRDNQLFKLIKQQGSLVKHPKEDQIYLKNREDYEKAIKLQEEKCVLANTALFSIAKHLTRLENDIERLEQEGVVPPILNEESSEEEDADNGMLDMLSSQISSTSLDSLGSGPRKNRLPRKSRHSTPSNVYMGGYSGSMMGLRNRMTSEELSDYEMDDMILKAPRKKSSFLEHGASGTVTIPKAPRNSNEEDELYCFCQQVSYGNMIACDNSDCKYEWFHYDCVGLKEPPQGIWYCPDCRKDLELGRKTERRRRDR
ncbi:hypothetical protein OGAPHI_005085 [Ogataea philodendri]|uniref:Chromatin modification-related protein n=1 Tax=Ogataea philodendri TaxID=1378263 RepID=A0A9P8P247_9ASCO|nr:uncharacterized protein OGAPHI_005085 [Ogataea philodendri]KAH3663684.1 hypothetical protein OGAPHI_005085 [Ogataea philodendri]